MTDICASPLFSNQTICKVMEIIDNHIEDAHSELDNANTQLDALQQVVTDGVTNFDNVSYTPGTSGIPTTYSSPSIPSFSSLGPQAPTLPSAPEEATSPGVPDAPAVPAAHSIPEATTRLIQDTDFNSIFSREADRIARVNATKERNATYRAASRGIGMSSAALTQGLKEAENDTLADISMVARDKATQEAVMIRDDITKLHELHIANWPLHTRRELDGYQAEHGLKIEGYKAETAGATQIYDATVRGLLTLYNAQVAWITGYLGAENERYRALISSEAERRSWSDMQVQIALKEAEDLTKYALEKMRYLTDITREVAQAKAQLITGAFQALISAANVNLSGSGSQGVSESV